MYNLTEFLENFNSRPVFFQGSINFNEPMDNHTTFKTGGPAGLWIRPEGECFPDYTAMLLDSARQEGIPVFILGGGANIVMPDKGIRGIVLDTTGYGGLHTSPLSDHPAFSESELWFRAGTSIDYAVDYAADHGLSGLEFLAGMPGTIGGALWMNARCYDKEMADVVREVQILEGNKLLCVRPNKEEFDYKISPFQKRDCLIMAASFSLQEKDTVFIRNEIKEHRDDRESKGHYRYPSAGSVFKNSRAIGKPTGKIIDELGLRGLSVGGAQVAPWHGNIIINKCNASSAEILSLVELLEERVKSELGVELTREIIFVG
ncbi:MAG: UDP-N-acetylmuramate dehydrogenase [Treponema sp.]|nr:UDP-N-acetylmuramate dehydrogenase [Treponema sp.]